MQLRSTPAYVRWCGSACFPARDVLSSPWPEKLAPLLLMVHQAGDGKSAPMKKTIPLEAWGRQTSSVVRRKRCRNSTSWSSSPTRRVWTPCSRRSTSSATDRSMAPPAARWTNPLMPGARCTSAASAMPSRRSASSPCWARPRRTFRYCWPATRRGSNASARRHRRLPRGWRPSRSRCATRRWPRPCATSMRACLAASPAACASSAIRRR